MTDKLRVGVIFGGRSGEHEVSLLSAASVMEALDKTKYEVVPIGITKSGRWLLGPGALPALRAGAGNAPLLGEGHHANEPTPATLLPEPSRQGLVVLDSGSTTMPLEPLDVVFPVLHGPYGEDGTVQGLLELAAIPYVGAGVAASAVGMDKALMKSLFRQAGIPVADFAVLLRRRWRQQPQAVLQEMEGRFGYPCFIKPANLGSSVGVSKARDRRELAAALEYAACYDRKLLLERFIPGREVECSVLGNDEPIASAVGEVVPAREFYDYHAKYLDERTRLVVPVMLDKDTEAQIQRLAIRAFQAVDCAGMARVDFFLTPAGEVFLNEINTIPGFTAVSMYPKLWEASGISYRELLDRLIQLALERYEDKKQSSTTYAP